MFAELRLSKIHKAFIHCLLEFRSGETRCRYLRGIGSQIADAFLSEVAVELVSNLLDVDGLRCKVHRDCIGLNLAMATDIEVLSFIGRLDAVMEHKQVLRRFLRARWLPLCWLLSTTFALAFLGVGTLWITHPVSFLVAACARSDTLQKPDCLLTVLLGLRVKGNVTLGNKGIAVAR